jgi:hypothetical protein
MTIKSKLAVIATSAALGIAVLGAASPALAQSAWTTGTESNRVANGYASPYGGGLYDHDAGFAPRHSSGLEAFAMVPRAGGRFSQAADGGGSTGYNENLKTDQW